MFLTSNFVTNKGLRKHFRLLNTRGPVNLAAIAEELRRSSQLGVFSILFPYATLVHRDRITKLSCEVKGEVATGTVWFRTPGLCEGDFDYLARRVQGTWRIEEFRFPRAGFRLVFTRQGLWKRRKLQ